MAAKVHRVGRSAHDAERQALAWLAHRLPDGYTLYANAWIAQRSGVIYELDAVVAAPHGIFVVETKAFGGRITGTDHDWFAPHPMRSPLRLNRLTAQVLASELKRESSYARGVWVSGYVFLSQTLQVDLSGTASASRVHTRKGIIEALTDPDYLYERITGGRRTEPVDDHVAGTLHRLLTGVDKGRPPAEQVREYTLLGMLGRSDDHVEYLARHRLTQKEQVLRVYTIPWSASQQQRQQIQRKASWEASVLVNVGRSDQIVSADAPFIDEMGVCLPLEYFQGITLASWVERYLADDAEWPSLMQRLRIWSQVAQGIDYAHRQGVVHRLLRPDVILIENNGERPALRLTGFDLAKRMEHKATVAWSTVEDERMVWAAPEVLRDLHDAEPRSDQFSLGMLFGLLATGEPPAPSTKAFLQRGGKAPHLGALDARLPKALDPILRRMLAPRPSDRFDSVADAVAALREALSSRKTKTPDPVDPEPPEPGLDPEQLEPGTRLGSDYELVERIGAGGLSTVYRARNLAMGRSFVLKVARADEAAEEALRSEYEVLDALDHPRIVKVRGLSKVVPERMTLIMELVEGQPLPAWLDAHPDPEPSSLQRHAEDLFDVLAYLEAKGLTHKDIKPDNLILGKQGLTLIDFSLVDQPPDRIFAGTALYRDPSLRRWDAAADRYAAALCLFELYVGVHAFEGQAPEPDRLLRLDEDEIEPSALAGFMHQALHPDRGERHEDLATMRAAYRRALGQREETEGQARPVETLEADPNHPLAQGPLSRGTRNALQRAGIRTYGQLVAAEPEQIRRVRMIGRLRLREVLALRDRLIALEVEAQPLPAGPVEAPMLESLAEDERPLSALRLSDGLSRNLEAEGFHRVGHVAAASEGDLLRVASVGKVRLVHIRRSLERLLRMDSAETALDLTTLESAWADATRSLTSRQREVLGARYGRDGAPQRAVEVAEEDEVSRAAVYLHLTNALQRLDPSALEPAIEGLRQALDEADGLLGIEDAAAVVAGRLETEDEALALFVARVLAVHREGEMVLIEGIPGLRGELIALPAFEARQLRELLSEAERLADWPPKQGEAARDSLAATLPGFAGDPVELVARIASDLDRTDAGELFRPPVDPRLALPFLLHREQLPMALDALKAEIDAHFNDQVDWPADQTLADLVAELDLPGVRLDGDQLVARGPDAVEARPGPEPDALPAMLLTAERSPSQIVGGMLAAAQREGSWRMVVTPPDQHPELGRNIARAMGPDANFISFEAELLGRMESDFAKFEKAERFAFLRDELTEAAETLLRDLLREHGRPGAVNVLGDLALLELCQATHLVQQIYNATLGTERGMWVVVVPGIIHKQQPMLNRSAPLFHIEGAVLPLDQAIPVEDPA